MEMTSQVRIFLFFRRLLKKGARNHYHFELNCYHSGWYEYVTTVVLRALKLQYTDFTTPPWEAGEQGYFTFLFSCYDQ